MSAAHHLPPDWRSRALLRASLVAKATGLSLRTVRRMIANGSLPSRLIGGARLVPVQAVLELVGESEPEPTAQSMEEEGLDRWIDEILRDFQRSHG